MEGLLKAFVTPENIGRFLTPEMVGTVQQFVTPDLVNNIQSAFRQSNVFLTDVKHQQQPATPITTDQTFDRFGQNQSKVPENRETAFPRQAVALHDHKVEPSVVVVPVVPSVAAPPNIAAIPQQTFRPRPQRMPVPSTGNAVSETTTNQEKMSQENQARMRQLLCQLKRLEVKQQQMPVQALLHPGLTTEERDRLNRMLAVRKFVPSMVVESKCKYENAERQPPRASQKHITPVSNQNDEVWDDLLQLILLQCYGKWVDDSEALSRECLPLFESVADALAKRWHVTSRLIRLSMTMVAHLLSLPTLNHIIHPGCLVGLDNTLEEELNRPQNRIALMKVAGRVVEWLQKYLDMDFMGFARRMTYIENQYIHTNNGAAPSAGPTAETVFTNWVHTLSEVSELSYDLVHCLVLPVMRSILPNCLENVQSKKSAFMVFARLITHGKERVSLKRFFCNVFTGISSWFEESQVEAAKKEPETTKKQPEETKPVDVSAPKKQPEKRKPVSMLVHPVVSKKQRPNKDDVIIDKNANAEMDSDDDDEFHAKWAWALGTPNEESVATSSTPCVIRIQWKKDRVLGNEPQVEHIYVTTTNSQVDGADIRNAIRAKSAFVKKHNLGSDTFCVSVESPLGELPMTHDFVLTEQSKSFTVIREEKCDVYWGILGIYEVEQLWLPMSTDNSDLQTWISRRSRLMHNKPLVWSELTLHLDPRINHGETPYYTVLDKQAQVYASLNSTQDNNEQQQQQKTNPDATFHKSDETVPIPDVNPTQMCYEGVCTVPDTTPSTSTKPPSTLLSIETVSDCASSAD